MLPAIELLADDSGELMAVTGHAVPGDRFTALSLQFAAGTLQLECDDDTDEILVSVIDGPSGGHHAALADLVGLSLDSAWDLRNQRGYVDGFQIRLRDGHGREETVQFEVGASAIDVRRVVG